MSISPAFERYTQKIHDRYGDPRSVTDGRVQRRPLSPLMKIHRGVRERFKYEFNMAGNEHRFVVPRQISMYLMKRLLPWASYPLIGIFYGGRHHTTVMHAIRRIEEDRHLDANLDRLIVELEKELAEASPERPCRAVLAPAALRRALIAYVGQRNGS